ncbi:MAG: extensin family protein [Povalibacter sp.]
MGFKWIAFATLLVLAGLAAVYVREHLPPRLNPWAPLEIDAAPNFLTGFKLSRASNDANACRTALTQTTWQYTPIENEITAPGCGYTNAIRIERMDMSVSSPFAVSCREALSLAMWERHVLQPAALRYFGEPITKIEHFGSYSCRTVYGRPNANMSHHATADAFDVAGFVIGEHKRVRVVRDWLGSNVDAQFLHEVHDGASTYFDTVLGPDYNAAHRDHFHLDRGRYRVCR